MSARYLWTLVAVFAAFVVSLPAALSEDVSSAKGSSLLQSASVSKSGVNCKAVEDAGGSPGGDGGSRPFLDYCIPLIGCGACAAFRLLAAFGKKHSQDDKKVMAPAAQTEALWETPETSATESLVAEVLSWQALSKAARGGDAGLFMELTEGYDANVHDTWGVSLIHIAASAGSVVLCEKLLRLGASVVAIDMWEATPLHFAARSGSVEVCKFLLDNGACANRINAHDWTPLLDAAHAGHEPVCKFLLSRGCGVGGACDADLPPLLQILLTQAMIQSLTNCEAPQAQVDEERMEEEDSDEAMI